MDHHLRGLLFIAVLVSINFSSSAQNSTPSDEDDSIDIHVSNVCIPATNLCEHPHINSVIVKPTEEAVTDEDSTKFKPSTICDPITKVCQGPHTVNSYVTDSPLEASGEENASQSDPSIICDPITHICRESTPKSLVSESDKDGKTEYGSIIHEEKEKISPLVCDPNTGNCQEPHHNFGVAQPRDEDDSIDIHLSNVCIPGTNLCDHPHINSVIAEPTEEAVTDKDSIKFKPSTICNPITKVCQGPHIVNSDVTDSSLEASGEEDASQSDPLIICDPITHICGEPTPNSLVSESNKDEQTEDGSVIHEEKDKISSLVCDPHHGFGVAQPRDEVA